MDSIFKDGQEVWFTWELDDKTYESFGIIDEVYYFNDVRKHKYRIIALSPVKQKAFYIWEDKISFYKKKDRDKLRCVDCKYNKDVISIGRCASCACSHRLFEAKKSYSINKLEEAYSKAEAMCDNSEPRKVCKTCKNRECGLAYEPCVICKDHNMWESTKVNPFLIGDLVMYKDASKPDIFTVIEIIEFHSTPGGAISYSYRIKRTDKDGRDIVNLVDHDRLEKVDKQYTGGYIYPVGAHIRYEDKKQIKCGTVVHHYELYESKEEWYFIREDGKSSSDKCDHILGCHILGYAANWIDDPSIRKAFGLDIKNDIYENIKKQINKDQLNFHYGLHSIFPLAPNDAAVPFELSEERKEYIRNDVAATMSYIHELHKNGFYGTGTDTKIIIDDVLKEDNMKNTKLIRSNGTYKKEIKNVIFSGPVTTVVFDEEFDPFGRKVKSKTNVRCQKGDEFDKTTGFLLALVKTFVDKQSYDNILRTIDGFEEDKIEKHVKYTRKHIKLEKKCEDDWKFMVGDLVRLKSGNIIFKVVRTLTWNYNGKVIHRYAIRRFGGSKYITYENENRLTLVEPTTDRLTKSMIKE